jgi:hypothetical protein
LGKFALHPSFLTEILAEKLPAVLVFVAVEAEILPVGAVRGIIPGIPILVVHRKLVPVFVRKLPLALGADHPVDFQGLLPVT